MAANPRRLEAVNDGAEEAVCVSLFLLIIQRPENLFPLSYSGLFCN